MYYSLNPKKSKNALSKAVSAITAAMIFTAAILAGCSSGQPAKITVKSSQYETDTLTVYTEYPVFSFMDDKILENSLNDEYEKEVQGKTVEFEGMDNTLSGGNKCVLEIRQQIPYNAGTLISVVSEEYSYTGGAHGQTVRSAKNIDTSMGKSIKLADLFTDESYIKALDNFIMEEVENHPEEYSDLWEKPVIKDSSQTDFYFSEDGLVVFYQPYDLSYYARGFVDFTIDYENISGYLKEEYRTQLCKK